MKDYNSLADGERYFNPEEVQAKVSIGMLDISRDIDNEFIRKRCFDISYWMINQSVKLGLASYVGFHHRVEFLLEEGLKAGNQICIVLSQGMMAPRLYKIISKSVKYFEANPNFFVMGHIMAHKDRYPGLHRQMLIVNLKKWEELGKPNFLEQGFFWDRKETYPNFVLSEETMSSDYTPAWIKRAPGYEEFSVVEDGSNWLALAFENNIRVDNFDFEIRECKCFLYPYDNPELLEKVWLNLQDEESIDSIKNYSQRAWVRKLAYQEKIEKNRVYAYNTERLSGEGVRAPFEIDSIFSAAAGFKTIALLRNNGFHKNTIVNYYDWCSASLDFRKHLLETWDGVNFDKWLLEHDLEYNFSGTYRGNYKDFWDKELKNEFGSAENFKDLWDRYRKLKHNFFVIDIVNEPEKLFEEINNQKGVKVLWTTNIWPTMMLHWNVDIDIIEQKYLNFESMIPEDLVLYGQDYLANDLQSRVRGNNLETHPRYKPSDKYVLLELTNELQNYKKLQSG
jgi:hypothetical protein